jgi:dipeptide transport system ATP-binding protein
MQGWVMAPEQTPPHGERAQPNELALDGHPASKAELAPAPASTPAPTPALRAEGLTRHYRSSSAWWRRAGPVVHALEDVSFTLQRGHTLAVVGESGCGKSTLARQLTLAEPATRGRLWLEGELCTGARGAALHTLRRQVQMVFQNPYASLNPRRRIASTLAEPLRIHTRLRGAALQDRLADMMQKVGLAPEHLQRFPHMLSGGQRQRIAIARAMMLSPAVVVADEPTSALDVSIQAQILNLFKDLQAASGVAYVFISHNLSVVEFMADEVMVMYLGRCVEQGPRDVLFAQPRHPYTQALLAATPRVPLAGDGPPAKMDPDASAPRWMQGSLQGELPSPLHPPSGCAFHPRCPQAQRRCQEERPLLRQYPSGARVACHLEEGPRLAEGAPVRVCGGDGCLPAIQRPSPLP